jgi:hypothetical protein
MQARVLTLPELLNFNPSLLNFTPSSTQPTPIPLSFSKQSILQIQAEMTSVKNPTIKWAQRSNLIYLTLEVGDMKVEELSVVDDSFKIRSVPSCSVLLA